MDVLILFAEVSIAIIAFTSIVTQFLNFKNEEYNRGMFLGMIVHAALAFVFSALPLVLDSFFTDKNLLLKICSWLIGIITFSQGVTVLSNDRSTRLIFRIVLMIFSAMIFLLQLLNVFGYYDKILPGPYLTGIFWHILQSLIIFMIFIVDSQRKKEVRINS
jgi:hypothetical protein